MILHSFESKMVLRKFYDIYKDIGCADKSENDEQICKESNLLLLDVVQDKWAKLWDNLSHCR